MVNKVMPDRRSIFGNWADYCSVEMEKLLIWNSRSLKLLIIIDVCVVAIVEWLIKLLFAVALHRARLVLGWVTAFGLPT